MDRLIKQKDVKILIQNKLDYFFNNIWTEENQGWDVGNINKLEKKLEEELLEELEQ